MKLADIKYTETDCTGRAKVATITVQDRYRVVVAFFEKGVADIEAGSYSIVDLVGGNHRAWIGVDPITAQAILFELFK